MTRSLYGEADYVFGQRILGSGSLLVMNRCSQAENKRPALPVSWKLLGHLDLHRFY